MSPQLDDAHRPSRPRANTSTFPPFNWRRGRPDTTPAPTPESPSLPIEVLVEELTPPRVPSLSHARALANSLSIQTRIPRLASIIPVLATLCAPDSPLALQAAGYDILAAYWDNSSSVFLTTADRLSCLSFFLDLTVPWSPELWESRFKALIAVIQSGVETVGMESSLLKVLRSWIDSAFEGLLSSDPFLADERLERQRAVEAMTSFLVSLVGRAEFVSRVSDDDTAGVLQLFGRLIDGSLLTFGEHPQPLAALQSPLPLDSQISSSASSSRALSKHHRHQSSLSLSPASLTRHPVDLAVDLYLNYLVIRLKAIAANHIKTILPLLFRALAYYASPLPRISLTPSSPHYNPMEKRIADLVESLVTGPYSSSCTILLKHHLFPSALDLTKSIQTTLGSLRTLRTSIRRVLIIRLARSYILRASSLTYTPSGAPGHIDLERDLMERAWAKDDVATWDLNRFRNVLCRAIRAWVQQDEAQAAGFPFGTPFDAIFNEAAGILKDMSQAFDEAAEGEDLDHEEVDAVGQVLQELVAYVRSRKNPDGSPLAMSLAHAGARTPFLSTLSALLAQDLAVTPLYSILPSAMLSIAQHLADADTTQLLLIMSERQSLSPTTPGWLDYWRSIIAIPDLYASQRPSTRQVAMDALQSVWEFVKDIPAYRRPLADVVYNFWKHHSSESTGDHTPVIMWRIMGDEIVLRNVENGEGIISGEEKCPDFVEDILDFLVATASEVRADSADTSSIGTLHAASPSPHSNAPLVSTTTASPVLSRMQSDYHGAKEKEPTIPSVMSLLSSLASGSSSRSQSQPPRNHPQPAPAEPPPTHVFDQAMISKSVGAVVALISSFKQLAFTSLALSHRHLRLATRIFRVLVSLLSEPASAKVKLTALQFLMRLRVDRDHKLYIACADYDKDGNICTLATLINRGPHTGIALEDRSPEEVDTRKARPRIPQERNGRRLSRGRGGPPSKSESSRSRSRVASRTLGASLSLRPMKSRDILWSLPEALPFLLCAESEISSEGFISYDPAIPPNKVILPVSSYLTNIVDILKTEKDWEVLSYVLCHLPTQLANKHFFCGPKSRRIIAQLLNMLCTGILDGKFAAAVENWPDGIIARDAHGLAYHTLTVLISYKRCFQEVHLQHRLVEVFLAGLNGQPSTIKCCLHALSLSAFELQPSMTKYLSRILEKLSQIMSNPAMAVHIIDFLSIVGSLRPLHVNFTEADYKMVFGVALQYLQHHNRPGGSSTIPWALSQHVRIMSYYIIYVWFLALKLPDRPRHIKFITRQLLLANEGKDEVDEPAVVCCDWLARYTYASADPRPANSILSDIIMNPTASPATTEPAVSEKTWVIGNAVVTIRTLARRGWIEVLSRRASGLTKFLCRAENVPMVKPGDVDPDFLSIPASLTADRSRESMDMEQNSEQARLPKETGKGLAQDVQATTSGSDAPVMPDPITGYVWSGSAPSQRRKDVAIDPSYFALQLSSYPDMLPSPGIRLVVDSAKLPAFFRNLDRMPVIDTHKVGIMYVAPGQTSETEILSNTHGSPAYARFLEGLGRLINLRGQMDVYAGGLDPDEDGEYAYAWWDDIGQVLYHTATLMPSGDDMYSTNKKRHIGNDFVRIIWNDSGKAYKFDTLSTQFQFVNIVIEPHSRGAIAAFSNNVHENEYFKVTLQRVAGMTEFTPIGDFKLISAQNLPLLVRQLSLLTDWFASVFQHTQNDTVQVEMTTNWRSRLQAIKRFRSQLPSMDVPPPASDIPGREVFWDFTTSF